MNPRYLFCDECTSALDPKSTIAILDLIKNLQKQFHITVVITHEMSVVQNICNRMAILENGQVSLMGDVKEIFEKQPDQLRNLIGEDDRKVSVTMDVEDFAKIQSYLDKNKTQYKISGEI